MDRLTLITVAREILQQPLAGFGYMLKLRPPGTSIYVFWFEKKPTTVDDLYRIIEIQSSGFNKNQLIRMAVNLARRPVRNSNDRANYYTKQLTFDVRLASCMWETRVEKRALDQWWDFGDSLPELRGAFLDILDKLQNYGIPFLDNPKSSWWTWAGEEPPKRQ